MPCPLRLRSDLPSDASSPDAHPSSPVAHRQTTAVPEPSGHGVASPGLASSGDTRAAAADASTCAGTASRQPQRSETTLALLALVAAVSAALIACGSGSDANGASGADGNSDSERLASSEAEAADLLALTKMTAVNAASGRVANDIIARLPAQDAGTVKTRQDGSGRIGYGPYPGVVQSNLAANRDGFGAPIIEPQLLNPWGIAIRPAGAGGHFWLPSAGSGQSVQYVGDVGGTALFQDDLKLVATGGRGTGTVFNAGQQFVITQQHPNGPITAPTKFFFANLTGTITAWTERARPGGGFDHPADAVTVVDGTAQQSAYIGVAVTPQAERLLAADFGATPDVRVYDGRFAEGAPFPNPYRVKGKGPTLEAFNVQTIGSSVFAMYGRHVPPTTRPLPTDGRLAEFDADGKLISKWYGRGLLNYPWGIQQAPDNFGLYSGCLLVGNFGDGTLVAFHPQWRIALDYVRDDYGRKVMIDKLWGLQFGNGASLGEADHLYFAAGPNDEQDGLFGKLQANPRTLPWLDNYSMCR